MDLHMNRYPREHPLAMQAQNWFQLKGWYVVAWSYNRECECCDLSSAVVDRVFFQVLLVNLLSAMKRLPLLLILPWLREAVRLPSCVFGTTRWGLKACTLI